MFYREGVSGRCVNFEKSMLGFCSYGRVVVLGYMCEGVIVGSFVLKYFGKGEIFS